jgi:hypothetical protein
MACRARAHRDARGADACVRCAALCACALQVQYGGQGRVGASDPRYGSGGGGGSGAEAAAAVHAAERRALELADKVATLERALLEEQRLRAADAAAASEASRVAQSAATTEARCPSLSLAPSHSLR